MYQSEWNIITNIIAEEMESLIGLKAEQRDGFLTLAQEDYDNLYFKIVKKVEENVFIEVDKGDD